MRFANNEEMEQSVAWIQGNRAAARNRAAAGLEARESDLNPGLVTKSSAGPQLLSSYVA